MTDGWVKGAKIKRRTISQWPDIYGVQGQIYTLNGEKVNKDYKTYEGIIATENDGYFEIVPNPSQGPVVTETVKRIVEGRYGIVQIDIHHDQIVVSIAPSDGHQPSAPELRAAAVVLTQLADALEESK